MADDKDREETFGSNPGADDPTASAEGAEQPGEELGGDADVPSTDDRPSDAPASDDGESSDEELEQLTDRRRDGVADESDDRDDDRDDDGRDDDGDRELVGVGAPSKQRSTAAGRGTGESKSGVASTKERAKKDKATPKQNKVEKGPKRTTPAQFVREAVGELRKVVYPTGSQLGNYFVVVLVFVLFIIGIVSLLDLGFGWVVFRVFA